MLRNFLGNLSSGVIRLVVTVGILAAVGFFIVKPVLDTTEKVSKEGRETFEKSFNGVGSNGVDTSASLKDVKKTLKEVNKTVEREIKRSFHVAKAHGVTSPNKLIKCIQRAEGNVHKIQRCTVKF